MNASKQKKRVAVKDTKYIYICHTARQQQMGLVVLPSDDRNVIRSQTKNEEEERCRKRKKLRTLGNDWAS